jgi:hypothetical protein
MRNFNTPWGITQSIKTLLNKNTKVYEVTTSTHGGVMIHKNEANLFSSACISRGVKFENYFCYEEDCDASIPFYEIKFKLNTNINNKSIETYYNWVSQFHPDYLIELEITPKPEDYQKWLQRRIFDLQNEKRLLSSIMNKDPRVAEVINNAIKAGSAKIEFRANQWWYIDPHFGKDTPLNYLNYNDELGLYIMKLAEIYDFEYR